MIVIVSGHDHLHGVALIAVISLLVLAVAAMCVALFIAWSADR